MLDSASGGLNSESLPKADASLLRFLEGFLEDDSILAKRDAEVKAGAKYEMEDMLFQYPDKSSFLGA